MKWVTHLSPGSTRPPTPQKASHHSSNDDPHSIAGCEWLLLARHGAPIPPTTVPAWPTHRRMTGYLGLEVPEQYGGSAAGDYRFNAVLGEELARSSAAAASSFGIQFDVVAPYLVTLTTEEQRQRWLPKFCTGELITAIAMTEPSGGSDLAALKTTAVKDGAAWVINGSKTFITNGTQADLIIVAARTSREKGSKGITLFAVDADTPGFSRGRKLDKVGQPESDTAELFFEDVRVDDTAIIGELDRGFIHMMNLFPQERISGAVAYLAHARRILEETVTYAQERKAFGRTIGAGGRRRTCPGCRSRDGSRRDHGRRAFHHRQAIG